MWTAMVHAPATHGNLGVLCAYSCFSVLFVLHGVTIAEARRAQILFKNIVMC